MRTPSSLRIAKHQTRFRRDLSKLRGDYRLSKCLTKGVLSCQGRPDTSHYVYPYPSSQCLGELGNSSVVSARTPKEKALKGCSVVERLKKMGLLHFPKPTKHPLRASINTGSTPTSELKHIFKRSAT